MSASFKNANAADQYAADNAETAKSKAGATKDKNFGSTDLAAKGKKVRGQKESAVTQSQVTDEDEDLKGEGETEDTGLVKNGFTYFSQGPKDAAALAKAEERKQLGQSSSFVPIQKDKLEVFPQRTTWSFPDSSIVFDSKFCSGNLAKAQRGMQKNCYDLWVASDAAPHMEGNYYRTWFYFSVTGVPQGEQLTFTFKNLNNQSKMYNAGLKPVFRVLPTQQKKWRRIISKATTFINNDDQFILSFNHAFTYPEAQTTYFAFSWPFSYQEAIEQADALEAKLSDANNVYFNRETLYYSLEGRKMELMTISSMDDILEEREPVPDDSQGLFPFSENDAYSRPFMFEKTKRVIFMTSRVHPAETPGSHALNGFIDLLSDLKSEQARMLRKTYVFKIIPILNPDGVSRGYYRLDTMAQNLNRFYLNPGKFEQPTIWATKKAVVQQSELDGRLLMFIDFHAHASKKGGFMFGNHLTDQAKQADNITFVKLVAMNCLNFDMQECNFSEKIMGVKDRNGQSREGSSRVALHKATGITYCYTLEFNYNSGKRINTLAPKYLRQSGTIEAETPVTDPTSKIYANCAAPPYTQDIFEDCGRAIGAALLDFVEDNPCTRIPLSCYRSITNVRTDICNNLQKYESGHVNVVGANHFAPSNTKVARTYASTSAPKVKIGSGSASSQAQKTEIAKLNKVANQVNSGPSKQRNGTFGISKRLTTITEDKRQAALSKNKTDDDSDKTSKEKRQSSGHNSASNPPPQKGRIQGATNQPSSAKAVPTQKVSMVNQWLSSNGVRSKGGAVVQGDVTPNSHNRDKSNNSLVRNPINPAQPAGTLQVQAHSLHDASYLQQINGSKVQNPPFIATGQGAPHYGGYVSQQQSLTSTKQISPRAAQQQQRQLQIQLQLNQAQAAPFYAQQNAQSAAQAQLGTTQNQTQGKDRNQQSYQQAFLQRQLYLQTYNQAQQMQYPELGIDSIACQANVVDNNSKRYVVNVSSGTVVTKNSRPVVGAGEETIFDQVVRSSNAPQYNQGQTPSNHSSNTQFRSRSHVKSDKEVIRDTQNPQSVGMQKQGSYTRTTMDRKVRKANSKLDSGEDFKQLKAGGDKEKGSLTRKKESRCSNNGKEKKKKSQASLVGIPTGAEQKRASNKQTAEMIRAAGRNVAQGTHQSQNMRNGPELEAGESFEQEFAIHGTYNVPVQNVTQGQIVQVMSQRRDPSSDQRQLQSQQLAITGVECHLPNINSVSGISHSQHAQINNAQHVGLSIHSPQIMTAASTSNTAQVNNSTSIPQIVGHQTMNTADYINHRSLKPPKKPIFATAQQQQHQGYVNAAARGATKNIAGGPRLSDSVDQNANRSPLRRDGSLTQQTQLVAGSQREHNNVIYRNYQNGLQNGLHHHLPQSIQMMQNSVTMSSIQNNSAIAQHLVNTSGPSLPNQASFNQKPQGASDRQILRNSTGKDKTLKKLGASSNSVKRKARSSKQM